ncbi:hypothetical protein CMMCAS08_06005 [Clavibacter michiganensis subsp. michiganensis]|nr:hypothetical protein CMMCAS08_06005 [Clavibacter michiganensis subsp. michiganensis]
MSPAPSTMRPPSAHPGYCGEARARRARPTRGGAHATRHQPARHRRLQPHRRARRGAPRGRGRQPLRGRRAHGPQRADRDQRDPPTHRRGARARGRHRDPRARQAAHAPAPRGRRPLRGGRARGSRGHHLRAARPRGHGAPARQQPHAVRVPPRRGGGARGPARRRAHRRRGGRPPGRARRRTRGAWPHRRRRGPRAGSSDAPPLASRAAALGPQHRDRPAGAAREGRDRGGRRRAVVRPRGSPPPRVRVLRHGLRHRARARRRARAGSQLQRRGRRAHHGRLARQALHVRARRLRGRADHPARARAPGGRGRRARGGRRVPTCG